MPPTIWYPEEPEDEFDFATDWVEAIDARSQPGGGISLTETAQDATLIGYVPANKLRSAARYFLGFSYADTDAPYLLYREPPMVHPQMPSLRCYGFGGVGDILKANPDNLTNSPYIVSPFEGPQGEELRYTSWQNQLVTLKFKSFGRMRFLLDDQISGYADEIKRYTRSFSDSAVQTLSVDGRSNLAFAEGEPGAAHQVFPAPIAQLLAKVSLRVLWASVPHEYLSTNVDFLRPKKLMERLGTVNDAEYIGNAKGTLLFTSFSAEEVLYPVLSVNPSESILSGWNITFSFEQFDPKKGVPDSEFRGHRIFPYSINGKWYYAWRADHTDDTTKELFPLTDYNKLTQHVQDDS